jgi:hypothetical protein
MGIDKAEAWAESGKEISVKVYEKEKPKTLGIHPGMVQFLYIILQEIIRAEGIYPEFWIPPTWLGPNFKKASSQAETAKREMEAKLKKLNTRLNYFKRVAAGYRRKLFSLKKGEKTFRKPNR